MFKIIKDKSMPKIKGTNEKKVFTLSKSKKVLCYLGVCAAIAITMSTEAYALTTAQTGDGKVFLDAYTKIETWVTGGFGKLIVGVSVILSVIMGVAGFKWQQILIPLILGLLLGSVSGIVGLFF
jgi:type IV secretory pathway VirB2 component (pilin)